MGLDAQAQTKTIGDPAQPETCIEIKMQPLNFEDGLPALLRLLRLMSPMLSDAVTFKVATAKLAAILQRLPELLDDATIQYYAGLFGKGSWAKTAEYSGDGDGVPLALKNNRAKVFETRYLEFTEWLMFGIEVSFGPFFAGAKRLAPNAASLAQLLGTSKSASKSGTGGDSSPTNE